MTTQIIQFPAAVAAKSPFDYMRCGRCGTLNQIVNQCQCDAGNLPTPIPAAENAPLALPAPEYSPEVMAKRAAVKAIIVTAGYGRGVNSRDKTAATIRDALKKRTGRAWSVTCGTGTAWGWIKVTAPPARCTFRRRPANGLSESEAIQRGGRDSWELYDTGEKGRGMGPEDIALLKTVFPDAGHDGESITSCHRDYELHLALALYGETLGFTFEPYWD